MLTSIPHTRYLAVLGALLAAAIVLSGLGAHYPHDWLLENALVGLFAVFLGGELGEAYLGTQGDVWDAQKDMAMASLGALVAMLATAAINARYQRDFARDFLDSLRVKRATPLGEEELAKMIR